MRRRIHDVLLFAVLAAVFALAVSQAAIGRFAQKEYRFEYETQIGEGVLLQALSILPESSNSFRVQLSLANDASGEPPARIGIVFHMILDDDRNVYPEFTERGYNWLNFEPDTPPRSWDSVYIHAASIRFPFPDDQGVTFQLGVWDYDAQRTTGDLKEFQIDFGQFDREAGGIYAQYERPTVQPVRWFLTIFIATLVLLIGASFTRDIGESRRKWKYTIHG